MVFAAATSYSRDSILGDLSQGLGLLLGEDLPRLIVRRGCVVKTMICGYGTIQGVFLVIISRRQIGQHVALAPPS